MEGSRLWTGVLCCAWPRLVASAQQPALCAEWANRRLHAPQQPDPVSFPTLQVKNKKLLQAFMRRKTAHILFLHFGEQACFPLDACQEINRSFASGIIWLEIFLSWQANESQTFKCKLEFGICRQRQKTLPFPRTRTYFFSFSYDVFLFLSSLAWSSRVDCSPLEMSLVPFMPWHWEQTCFQEFQSEEGLTPAAEPEKGAAAVWAQLPKLDGISLVFIVPAATLNSPSDAMRAKRSGQSEEFYTIQISQNILV